MEKIKRFFLVFIGALWEWILIPILFFIFLSKYTPSCIFPDSKFSIFISFLFLIPGLILTFLSCFSLHKKGKGTIMPQCPPEKLVRENVYEYCRNPMYLGYSFLFSFLGFAFRNMWFIFVSVGVLIFIIIYAKFYEEKKLIKKFGNEYLYYKISVPFIIPLKISFFKNKKRNGLFYLFLFSLFLLFFLFFEILRILFIFDRDRNIWIK